MTGRCDKTDLYTEQCAHCRRVDMPELREHHDLNDPWIQARYSGRCVLCDTYLEPGELIRRRLDGYVCHECGSEAPWQA